MKQRVITYVGMALASIVCYSAFLTKQCAVVQTLYLGLMSVIFSGDRPMHVYAVCASFPRDMK